MPPDAVSAAALASTTGAGFSGFSHSAPTGLPNSLLEKGKRTIYIGDAPFLAPLNGLDDDAPALRAAIDYYKPYGLYDGAGVQIHLGNKPVRLASASTEGSGQIDLTDCHGIRIMGESRGSTQVRNVNNRPAFYSRNTSSSPLSYLELKDFTILGPGAANTNADGVRFTANNSCVIDLRIWACRNAISLATSFQTLLRNIRVDGQGGLACYNGLYQPDGELSVAENALEIQGGQIFGCLNDGWRGECITGTKTFGLEVLGCVNRGVYFGDSPGNKELKWFTWAGGLIDTCADLLIVKKGGSSVAELLHFSGLWMGYAFENTPGSGIGAEFVGVNNVTFSPDLMVNMGAALRLDGVTKSFFSIPQVKDYDRLLQGAHCVQIEDSTDNTLHLGPMRKTTGSPTTTDVIETGSSARNQIFGGDAAGLIYTIPGNGSKVIGGRMDVAGASRNMPMRNEPVTEAQLALMDPAYFVNCQVTVTNAAGGFTVLVSDGATWKRPQPSTVTVDAITTVTASAYRLQAGDVIIAKGRSVAGDVDFGFPFLVESSGTANNGTVFSIGGGLFARLQFPDFASVQWFGAAGDGVTDDTSAIEDAIASGLPLDWGDKEYVHAGIDESTTTINWRSAGAVLRYSGAQIQYGFRLVLSTGQSEINGTLTFDGGLTAHVACRLESSATTLTPEADVPSLYAEGLTGIRAKRLSLAFPDGDGISIAGRFFAVTLDRPTAKDCYMSAGAEDPLVYGIFGITLFSLGAGLTTKHIRINDPYVENIWSEDPAYMSDQDGIRIFQDLTDREATCQIRNYTCINTSVRCLKLHSAPNAIIDGIYRIKDTAVLPQSGMTLVSDIDAQQAQSIISNVRVIYKGAWNQVVVRGGIDMGTNQFGGSCVNNVSLYCEGTTQDLITMVAMTRDATPLAVVQRFTVSNLTHTGDRIYGFTSLAGATTGTSVFAFSNMVGNIGVFGVAISARGDVRGSVVGMQNNGPSTAGWLTISSEETLTLTSASVSGFSFPSFQDQRVIASGVISTLGPSSTAIRVDTQGAAATDDLDTINNGSDGQIVTLFTRLNSRDVVVKHGTGNLVLTGGVDYTLALVTQKIALMYTAATSQWIELYRV